jgi:hypothetical protein
MKLKRSWGQSYPGKKQNLKLKPVQQRLILQIIGFSLSAAFLMWGIRFFRNPYINLALEGASLARPESELPAIPTSMSGSFCLSGDFQSEKTNQLQDDGANGDIKGGDGVYSLVLEVAEPGRYRWWVTDCADHDIKFPLQGKAWLYTEQRGQSVRFTLDTNVYTDRFYPPTYIVNAKDSGRSFVAVGDFQDWDNEAIDSVLMPVENGRFQRIVTIPEPGIYSGLVVAKGTWDGYMAYGRSDQWDTFQFRTLRPDERVAFLFDPQTGRTSIRYNIPYQLEQLAFAGLARTVGKVLMSMGVVTAVMQAWWWVVHHPAWQLKTGCSACGSYQLRRIPRQNSDLLLNLVGLPVRRFVCKQCGWHGRRVP